MSPAFTALKRTRILRRRVGKARRGRFLDPQYLAFVRSLPCIVCAREGCKQVSPTEAAHVGERGLGQKCSDREAVPLCGLAHHREGSESQHKLGKKFWAYHCLERELIIADLNGQYDMESGSVPRDREPSGIPWELEAGKTRRRMIAEELYG